MKLAHHAMTWEGWWKKHAIAPDLDKMFAEIKAAGYDGVELGGDEAKLGKPADLQKRLANHGLQLAAFNASVTANPWPPNTADFRKNVDYAAAMGAKIMMVCGGFFGFGRRTTFESDYKLFGENLTTANDYALSHGMHVSYHPHLGCMVETAAEVRMLLKFIPNLHLCVDTGHLTGARSDPVALIREHGKRITHVHLKDWNAENQQFAELGQGTAGLDFAAVFDALEETGYTGWLSVERDNVQMEPIDSAKMSREFLRKLARQPQTTGV